MARIGLVSCAPLPEPDPDEDLLLAALESAGLSATLVPWNRPGADVSVFDVCVLRSCWDYHFDPERFLAWITEADTNTRLLNSRAVVRWNIHKGYLRQLEAAGVPVVPTAWIGRGEAADLTELMTERGWDDVVVKPAIGAGSYLTRRFRTGEVRSGGDPFLPALLDHGDVMVQPYLPSVMTVGERSLVWIDGEFTHQVVKQPRYHGEIETVSGATPPRRPDLRVAEAALACVSEPLLYARVDLIEDGAGAALVSELELIEPSLFLLQHRPALDRFVAAIASYA